MILRSLSKSSGFTLVETIVAVAIWMILLAGASQLFWYTSQVSTGILARQEALEGTRVAVDALMVNLQMAEEIVLNTDSDGMLRNLSLLQVAPSGLPERFEFSYNRDALYGTPQYKRLNFGGNELASNLSEVRLTLSKDRKLIYITVTSYDSFGEPVTLIGAVDVRYKALN